MTPRIQDPKPEDNAKSPAFHESMFRLGDPAAPALQGIRPSEIADKLEAYEKLYAKELTQFPPAGGANRSWVARFYGFDHWRNALQIARMELKDLALAHATALNAQSAKVAQEDLNAQYTKLAGSLNDLSHFLFEHFGNDLAQAQAVDKPLFQLVKEIMLRLKKQ